jgi:asparagine synthetase A
LRNIVSITNNQGITHTDTQHILKTFTSHLKEKYGIIPIQAPQVQRMGQQVPTRLSNAANTDLEAQLTMDEMKTALRKGKKTKSTGE